MKSEKRKVKNPIALPLSSSYPLGLERLRKAYTGFPAQKASPPKKLFLIKNKQQ